MAAIKDQSAVTVTEIQIDSHTEELVSRAVSSAVEVFEIVNGHIHLPNDRCPLEVLTSTLKKITGAFGLEVDSDLDLNSRETLHRILQANFSPETQGLLEQETSEIFAGLSDTRKARILAQAIAETTIIFQRLADTHRTINYGLLNREAQLFAESDQRALMQESIEDSPVFEKCELKSEIEKAIKEAMEAEESAASPPPFASYDKVDFMFSPNAAHERPKNNGLPFGFTIMTIN